MRIPRIVIAAPCSGSGKTLVSIALMKALSVRGKKVAAFKCGPDYIDPLFHKKILGVPSKNLDLFFTDEEVTRSLFCDGNESDISVIEGVMGLYDGIAGFTETASTYQLAAVLKSPVVLVVNARGAGRSVIAQIKGFVAMDEKHLIKGVILNNMSESLCSSLKPDIEAECDVAVLGFVPTMKELNVESRYLGLTLPDEIKDIQISVEKAAAILCESVDVEKIVEIAEIAPDLSGAVAPVSVAPVSAPSASVSVTPASVAPDSASSASGVSFAPVRIAVAQDSAFCFYYDDNFKLLRRLGAELIPFSPVTDEVLPPDIDGLLLGGGYPELYAEKLEKNVSMRNAIKSAIVGGLPSLAECGGFMYLHERLQSADGVFHSMAGVIKGDCTYTGKSVRFGYCTVTEDSGAFFGNAESTDISGNAESAAASRALKASRRENELRPHWIKAHEFHYFDSTSCGESCTAEKPVTGRSWKCCHTGENYWWGFPHLYYTSNPRFAERFVEKCRAYRNSRTALQTETKAQKTPDSEQPTNTRTAPETRCTHTAELQAIGCAIPEQIPQPRRTTDGSTKHYKFFQNRSCEMFPCHKTDDPDNFNCLFCFCPLYFFGEKCGGNFHYNAKGRKSCVDCTFPHKKENYDVLMDKIRNHLKDHNKM